MPNDPQPRQKPNGHADAAPPPDGRHVRAPKSPRRRRTRLTKSEWQEMVETRKHFEWVFKSITIGVFILMTLMSVVLTFIGQLYNDRFDLVVAARMLQVSLGMVLGATCMLLGVLLSWLGISSAFRLVMGTEESLPGFRTSLSSTGPGIALIIGGIALIALCIWKEPSYERRLTPIDPSPPAAPIFNPA